MSYSLLGVLALATLAQLIRDRNVGLMLLMFVPLAPIALVALVWDVVLRGRSLRVRWLLSTVAVSCGLLACSLLWRPALSAELAPGQARLRVVQWNTMWGGRNQRAFTRILDRLDEQQLDIACLSEAPDSLSLEQVWTTRHPSWHVAAASNGTEGWYWYSFAVVSRYPVALRDEWKLARGRLALFEVDHPVRTLRILMVDLLSSPVSPRTPSIRQAAKLIEDRAKAGQAIDLVLGDFNTPARLLGFDALQAAAVGYRRASLWSGEWAGTWPSFVPFAPLDIDHVWVSTRLSIRNATFFSSFDSDHRGQRVDLSFRSARQSKLAAQPAWQRSD